MTTELIFRPIEKVKCPFFNIIETPVRFEHPFEKDVFKYYPGKKIIINENLNEAISIVGSSFLSVKHEDAFDLGVTIFKLLFDITPQIHKQEINKRTTDYSIDFISDKCKFVFDSQGFRFISSKEASIARSTNPVFQTLDRQNQQLNFISENFYDEYFPFLRVSNYLREGNSFYIELGYYRSRCSNGMMLGRKTKMTFKHSYRVASFDKISEAAKDQFFRYKNSFLNPAEKIWLLLSIHIPKWQIKLVPFDIFEKELIKKSITERKKLQLILNDLVNKYAKEIGENLNAALNVATEFSQFLEGNSISKSAIQNLSTTWMNRVTKDSFVIENYLKDIKNIEEKILNAKEVKEMEEEEIDYEQ